MKTHGERQGSLWVIVVPSGPSAEEIVKDGNFHAVWRGSDVLRGSLAAAALACLERHLQHPLAQQTVFPKRGNIPLKQIAQLPKLGPDPHAYLFCISTSVLVTFSSIAPLLIATSPFRDAGRWRNARQHGWPNRTAAPRPDQQWARRGSKLELELTIKTLVSVVWEGCGQSLQEKNTWQSI